MKKDYRINNDKFYELINQGWQVIDVRSKAELKFLTVLPNTTNIPYPKIIDQMTSLFPDKNSKLIMVCNGGNRSGMSALAFRNAGYENVFVLDQGIDGLNRQ